VWYLADVVVGSDKTEVCDCEKKRKKEKINKSAIITKKKR